CRVPLFLSFPLLSASSSLFPYTTLFRSFIVDFTFTAILLVPQLLAWVYSEPAKMWSRALGTWLVFMPVPVMVARLAEAVEAPISGQTVLGAMMVITAVCLLLSLRGWGRKMR